MDQNKTKVAGFGVTLVTATLIALWQFVEGEKFYPYYDEAGILTVCSGHTGPDVVWGKRWSKKECDETTEKDLTKFALVVLRCVQTPLIRGQFEALVVFAGNVGEWAFCQSGLARRINEGDFEGAEAEFGKWVYHSCKEKCQKSQGLVNRRAIELKRFKEKDPAQQQQARGSSIFRFFFPSTSSPALE